MGGGSGRGGVCCIWPAAFLDRMDGRLQRDRKRLHDYYHALVRESEKKKARGHAPPDPEKIEATKRAVGLELRRKLAELDERYAMEAALAAGRSRPHRSARVGGGLVGVPQAGAQDAHGLLESAAEAVRARFVAAVCGDSAFAVAFSNEEVEPLCQGCNSIRRPSS